ncbi:MAG TPA: hypothetical protein PLS90_07170 [Candidatus Sumerlaeota bacterium]|nr:hypothetical protein [Candidatus Sumerlaeota bacterium]
MTIRWSVIPLCLMTAAVTAQPPVQEVFPATPADGAVSKLTEDEVIHGLSDEPGDPGHSTIDRELEAAREAYIAEDKDSSLQHLTNALVILSHEAAWSAGEYEATLREAIAELEKLAHEVQEGQIERDQIGDRFKDAYSKVYAGLSRYHLSRAEGMVRERQTREGIVRNDQRATETESAAVATPAPLAIDVETTPAQTTDDDEHWRVELGRQISGATENVRAWSRETGREIRDEPVIAELQEIAGRIIAGTGWATEEVGEALNRFGEKIKQYGRDQTDQGRTKQLSDPDEAADERAEMEREAAKRARDAAEEAAEDH